MMNQSISEMTRREILALEESLYASATSFVALKLSLLSMSDEELDQLQFLHEWSCGDYDDRWGA